MQSQSRVIDDRSPRSVLRGLLIWLGVLVPLLLLMSALTLLSWPAAAQGPTDVSGSIDTPTTWTPAHSPYIVTGTVTIEGSGVLTIEAGVEVRFDAGVELRVASGPLLALGAAGQPITFTTNSGAPARGDWSGIFLQDTAAPSLLQYCLVEYAATGLAIGGDTDFHTVDHCTLRYNGDGGDWSSGGAINSAGDVLTVTHSLIYSNELGLRLQKSFGDVISGNQIYDNDGFGLGFIAQNAPGGGDSTVSGNLIHDNGGFGLGLVSQGIYDGGSNNVIAGNRIYDNAAAGAYSGDGLYLDTGANNIITGNSIYGNEGHGVWVRSQPTLQLVENIVRGNGQNGLTYDTLNAAPAALHSNVFCSNGNFQIENFWANSLLAEGNWFGTNSPAIGLEVSGTVDFTLWISMAVEADPSTLPADGSSTAAVTLTLTGGGYAVPEGYTVTVASSEGAFSPSLLATTGGWAYSTYTAGTTPGGVDVQATDQCAALLFPDVLFLQSYLDLAVSKAAGGLVVLPNKEYALEYTITISNVGLLTATDVVVSDTLPLAATYTGGDWTCAAGLCSRSLGGDLNPTERAVFTLPLELDESALACPIMLTNTVAAFDASGDVDPSDNIFTLTRIFDCLPDLVVVKNDNVGPVPDDSPAWLRDLLEPLPANAEQQTCVYPGEWISYTVAYVNSGLLTATQALITETTPDDTSYVGYGWTCLGVTCTRSLGDLPPGQGGVAHFTVRVDSAPPDLLVENEARIGGAEEDLYPPDNVSNEDTPICGSAAFQVYLPLLMKQYTPPVGPTPTPSPTPTMPPPPPEAYVSDVAVNEETNRVYIASPQLDAVFAVDPSGAGSIVATIPVGDGPLGLAVVTTTNKIYAANFNSWTLTAIRGSDHTPLTDIYVGAQACKAAADSADGRVYVTNHLESDNGAAAIDSQTDTFEYYYSRLHATQGRYGLDVDRAADKLFIAARDAGLIAIQDAYQPDQDPQIFKLEPPRVPFVVAFNPTTQHLFVTAADDGLQSRVVVLDPYSIQWNKGRWIKYRGYPVFVLERANAGWVAEIGVGLGAEEGIAVDPLTGLVYVTNADSDTVSVIQDDVDPANIRWLRDIAVGDYPQGIAIDAKTNTIYVGNSGSRDLSVIDGASQTVVKTIPLD